MKHKTLSLLLAVSLASNVAQAFPFFHHRKHTIKDYPGLVLQEPNCEVIVRPNDARRWRDNVPCSEVPDYCFQIQNANDQNVGAFLCPAVADEKQKFSI